MNLLHFHALWRTCSEISAGGHKKSALVAFRELHPMADTEQKNKTLSLGILLGFFKTIESKELTVEGKKFSQLDHWRCWQPGPDQLDTLEKIKIEFSSCVRAARRRGVLDLFCGAGGLGLGFEMAGFSVVAAVDNDKQAIEAHKKNFPNCETIIGDICEIASDPKTKLAGLIKNKKISGIIGGPPCQGFSFIGERVVTDHRNMLTSRFMDIVFALQPDFFLMENVGGLLNIGARPRFHKHLLQYAKSIGPAATTIAQALPDQPDAPNRRERQYNKRLVSTAVSRFQRTLKIQKTRPVTASQVVQAQNKLVQILKSSMKKVFSGKRQKTAIQVIDKSETSIITIALSTVLLVKFPNAHDANERACIATLQNYSNLRNELGKAAKGILEKYKNLKGSTNFKGIQIGPILSNLIQRASNSYIVSKPELLSAAWYGAPQDRKRLFIVGIHKKIGKEFVFPLKSHFMVSEKKRNNLQSPAITCDQAIGDLPDIDIFPELLEKDTIPSSFLYLNKSPFADWLSGIINKDDKSFPRKSWDPFSIDCCKRTIHSKHVVERLRNVGLGVLDSTSGKTRLKPHNVAHTLRAGTREAMGSHTAVRPIHYKYNRVISVREGARLMGFPDWMTFHPTKWHGFRLVGNGVPAQLGRAIANAIQDQIYRSKTEQQKNTCLKSLHNEPSVMALSLDLN